MNFSKKGTIEKQHKIQSASSKLVKKTNIIIYRTFLVIVVLMILVGATSAYGVVKGLIDNAPDVEGLDLSPSGFRTYLYDTDGNVLQTLVGSDANREYVTIDKIPENVKNAFIAIEDERFMSHNGIDIRGMFRAVFLGLSKREFSQGASTITQQLLKNQVFDGGNETNLILSFKRKIQEQYLAVKLENIMPKDKILENYLNTINLGANTLGVQTASKRYFNKNVQELTLSEAAVIASITQSPANLNPITNPENNIKRRDEVLKKMLELKMINQQEFDEAMADDVYTRIQETNVMISSSYKYNSYFVDELIEQVTDDLVDKLGYTTTQASNKIYKGGLRIYTTQDSSIQNICDSVINDMDYYPNSTKYSLTYALSVEHTDGSVTNYSEGHIKLYMNNEQKKKDFDLYFDDEKEALPYIEKFRKHVVKEGDTILGEKYNFTLEPQVSFSIMDQATGYVKAIVGGRGEKTGNLTLNRATNTTRQPGSCFKVLSTYLPALDRGNMTLASVQDDAKYYYPGTKDLVNNWSGKNDYKGLTTLRQAIKRSMNVVTVKTLADITPQVGFDYLLNLGFTTLVENRVDKDGRSFSDIGLPLALGGITDGVTNLELNAAYASIANGGIYQSPIFYTKITDSEGNVLLENKSESKQVMKASTAWLLTDAMKDVVSAGGTGSGIKFRSSNIPIAGKTGTTSNEVDIWFSGYTPYYTATIWCGYDYNKKLSNSSFHKKIWTAIMDKVHEELEYKDFEKPDTIKSATICTKCGKLAIEGLCDHAEGGSAAKTEYFAAGTVPTDFCDCHVAYTVCKESGKRSTEYCPDTEEKVFLIKGETSDTDDTPYILPAGFDTKYCTIHEHAPVPGEDINGENTSPSPSPIPPTVPDTDVPPDMNDNFTLGE